MRLLMWLCGITALVMAAGVSGCNIADAQSPRQVHVVRMYVEGDVPSKAIADFITLFGKAWPYHDRIDLVTTASQSEAAVTVKMGKDIDGVTTVQFWAAKSGSLICQFPWSGKKLYISGASWGRAMTEEIRPFAMSFYDLSEPLPGPRSASEAGK